MKATSPVRTVRILFALLVALTAIAGAAAAVSQASATRIGATVSGAIAKQAGPVATRAVRGSAATAITSTTQRATSAVRAGGQEADGHSLPLLAVVAGLLVLAGLTGPGVARSERTSPLASTPVALHRGRSPPAGMPVPA